MNNSKSLWGNINLKNLIISQKRIYNRFISEDLFNSEKYNSGSDND